MAKRMLAKALRGRSLRAVLALVVVGTAVLLTASAGWATHGANVFSGRWTTKLYDGSAGSVTFKLVSDTVGAPGLEGLGGHACGAPTTYYGEYTFRTSTQIETAAPEIDWLNRGISISVGGRGAAGVIYETYLVA